MHIPRNLMPRQAPEPAPAAAKQQQAPAEGGVSHAALWTATQQEALPELGILELRASAEQRARFRQGALDMLVEPVPRYLTLRQAPEYLRERGYPVSFSALRRLCMPSRGRGPPVTGRWGQRLLFAPADLLAWAERRVHDPPAKGPTPLALTMTPHVERPCVQPKRRKCGEDRTGAPKRFRPVTR